MYQCVGVAEVVEKFIAEAFTFVGTGDETGDVKELDWNRSLSIITAAIIWLAFLLEVEASAGTVDL